MQGNVVVVVVGGVCAGWMLWCSETFGSLSEQNRKLGSTSETHPLLLCLDHCFEDCSCLCTESCGYLRITWTFVHEGL